MGICKPPVNRSQRKLRKNFIPPATESQSTHTWNCTDYGTHINLNCSDCGQRTCVDHGTDIEEDYPYCPRCGKRKTTVNLKRAF